MANPDFEGLIRKLEYQHSLWKEEYDCYGPSGTVQKNKSAMKASDLNFLTSNIRKIRLLKEQVELTFELVNIQIDERLI